MRYISFLIFPVFIFCISINTGYAKHMIRACEASTVNAVYNHGQNDPNALVCCYSNNLYTWIKGSSCPSNSGQCPSGQKVCAGPGPHFRCIPQADICRPMKWATRSAARSNVIVPPTTYIPINPVMPATLIPTPCNTTASASQKTNNPPAACAPKVYCAKGQLADYDACSKRISGPYQQKRDQIQADMHAAALLIQDDWQKILSTSSNKNLDLNAVIQNCIHNPKSGQSLNACVTQNAQIPGSLITAGMSSYLKTYQTWILDTSLEDEQKEILKQCGDPSKMTCDEKGFGCHSVCTTNQQTGVTVCSD